MCKKIDRLIENEIPVPTYNIEQIFHQILYAEFLAYCMEEQRRKRSKFRQDMIKLAIAGILMLF